MKEEAVASRSLILTNRRKILALAVADPAAIQVEIDNLVEANCELVLAEMIWTLQREAFDYFEKFLLPVLGIKW